MKALIDFTDCFGGAVKKGQEVRGLGYSVAYTEQLKKLGYVGDKSRKSKTANQGNKRS